jgi:AraC family transcriptional regulator, regulatory protein of adaptative response / DNA-3-methyladenine glycosylase II
VELDADSCYRAVRARDARFDGVFFVAVETTGVYCRPVCRARLPERDRCVFYRLGAEAERDGYRACFRCRPEVAPGGATIDSLSRLAQAAVERIDAGFLNGASVDDLGAELGVSGRHLRRAMMIELGISPIELAQSRRLALAKQLLHDSSLSLTDIAFASGFSSVRRFNALVRERFGHAPSALRRVGRSRRERAIALRLDYRAPFGWDTLLEFLASRAIPGVEAVIDGRYFRTVRIGDRSGYLSVRNVPAKSALRAEVAFSLRDVLMPIGRRLRALFDLDAHPAAISRSLAHDRTLEKLFDGRPGIRVPGAFDGFETLSRAIVGQQVSVRAATTLAGRIARELGAPIETPIACLDRTFPPPLVVSRASEDRICKLGLPGVRGRALIALARAVERGQLRLAKNGDPSSELGRLRTLPGIGEWTVEIAALRVYGWPDAFPASDLGVRKALGNVSTKDALERAESWRPWRAYALMQLWTALARGEVE